MNSRKVLLISIWTYCLSWAFDFRGVEQGGTAVQYLFFALTLASAATVIFLGLRSLFALPLGWAALVWGVYLVSTFVVALVNHVDLGGYFRNFIPPLLLFTSLCVTQVAAASGFHYRHVLWPMLIAGSVNVLWRAFYAVVIAGIPLETIRVEMLSPCLPFLIGWMFCGMLYSRRIPWLALAIGGIATASYVLSITRSAAFIYGAAGFAGVVTLFRMRSLRLLDAGWSQRKLKHGLGAAGILTLAFALLFAAAPFVIERWTERLFNPVGGESSSADPSALTRYAETKAFITILNQQPVTWAYGKGLGYPYYWDDSYAVELARYTYGNEDIFRAYIADIRFPGHSIWTYAVFSGGVIGFICYVWLFIFAIRHSLKSLRALTVTRDYPLEVACLPFLALLGFLSQSLTFNPFIERGGGLVIGIFLGFPQFLYCRAWQIRNAAAAPGITPGITPGRTPVRTAALHALR